MCCPKFKLYQSFKRAVYYAAHHYQHIKELESEFEIKLFDRTGNKISLTNAGIIILSYTDHIIALHNEAKFELSQ